jgi:phosphatidylinositol-bisphosphatase
MGYPEIVAIGFQELVNLSGKEVAKELAEIEGSMKTMAEQSIDDALNQPSSINSNGSKTTYTLLLSKQLVGIMLLIFVKSDLREHVRQLEFDQIKTGIGVGKGKMGNKGGMAVRFTLFDSQFCFITSHFAAGATKVENRNADYKAISSGLKFNVNGKELNLFDHE